MPRFDRSSTQLSHFVSTGLRTKAFRGARGLSFAFPNLGDVDGGHERPQKRLRMQDVPTVATWTTALRDTLAAAHAISLCSHSPSVDSEHGWLCENAVCPGVSLPMSLTSTGVSLPVSLTSTGAVLDMHVLRTEAMTLTLDARHG